LAFTLYVTRNDGNTGGNVAASTSNNNNNINESASNNANNSNSNNNINNNKNKNSNNNANSSNADNNNSNKNSNSNANNNNNNINNVRTGEKIEDEKDDEKKREKERKKKAIMNQRLFELEELNKRMISNNNATVRWPDMKDVPPLPSRAGSSFRNELIYGKETGTLKKVNTKGELRQFFDVGRPRDVKMTWEKEFKNIANKDVTARPNYVNYVHHEYKYPEKLMEPPELGKYPKMRTYKEVQDTWPQDALDNPPPVLEEDLLHFDYHNPADMQAAVKFRDAKLPFKVINVPDVMAATKKWTDKYIMKQFDTKDQGNGPKSRGICNEGPDNFFAFFYPPLWHIQVLGLPPTRNNNFSFKRWAKHAHYADRVGLDANLPHFYWTSNVATDERYKRRANQTFVSRDLPSFSETKENFFAFNLTEQQGIQCRFGERGITAANHYDSGRNMIAMITGAKRYILSPPRACKRLGIVSSNRHSSYRHSMLNYGHMELMKTRDDMPQEEREWMEMAGTAEAISTVLKEGEILYVPTGWFHYITSLQKSAQCNVRSGIDMVGDKHWGGANDIQKDCFPQKE